MRFSIRLNVAAVAWWCALIFFFWKGDPFSLSINWFLWCGRGLQTHAASGHFSSSEKPLLFYWKGPKLRSWGAQMAETAIIWLPCSTALWVRRRAPFLWAREEMTYKPIFPPRLQIAWVFFSSFLHPLCLTQLFYSMLWTAFLLRAHTSCIKHGSRFHKTTFLLLVNKHVKIIRSKKGAFITKICLQQLFTLLSTLAYMKRIRPIWAPIWGPLRAFLGAPLFSPSSPFCPFMGSFFWVSSAVFSSPFLSFSPSFAFASRGHFWRQASFFPFRQFCIFALCHSPRRGGGKIRRERKDFVLLHFCGFETYCPASAVGRKTCSFFVTIQYSTS